MAANVENPSAEAEQEVCTACRLCATCVCFDTMVIDLNRSIRELMALHMRSEREVQHTMEMYKKLIGIRGAIEIYFESDCKALAMVKELIKFQPEMQVGDERYSIHDEILEFSHQISQAYSNPEVTGKQGKSDICRACAFDTFKQ